MQSQQPFPQPSFSYKHPLRIGSQMCSVFPFPFVWIPLNFTYAVFIGLLLLFRIYNSPGFEECPFFKAVRPATVWWQMTTTLSIMALIMTHTLQKCMPFSRRFYPKRLSYTCICFYGWMSLGNWTHNPDVVSAMLYQLSHTGQYYSMGNVHNLRVQQWRGIITWSDCCMCWMLNHRNIGNRAAICVCVRMTDT